MTQLARRLPSCPDSQKLKDLGLGCSQDFHMCCSTAAIQQPRFRRSQLRPPPREEEEGGRSSQYSGPRSYGIPNHCLRDTGRAEQGKDKESRLPSCQGSADAQSARGRVRASTGTPGSLLTPATNRKYPVRKACGHTTQQAHTHQAGTQRLMKEIKPHFPPLQPEDFT